MKTVCCILIFLLWLNKRAQINGYQHLLKIENDVPHIANPFSTEVLSKITKSYKGKNSKSKKSNNIMSSAATCSRNQTLLFPHVYIFQVRWYYQYSRRLNSHVNFFRLCEKPTVNANS